MADGDEGYWENGETETYEISTENWREVDRDGGRLVRRCVLEPRFVTTSSLPYAREFRRTFFPDKDIKCPATIETHHSGVPTM